MIACAGEKVRTKCPKCRSTNFLLTEIVEELVIMEVKHGVIPNEASDHQPGSVIGLSATCSACGHTWRPRAKMVEDLVSE